MRPTLGPDHSPEGRLDSWKEIASYLGRGIRTVQRWEREEGLPVHRLAHEKRGSVYAHRDELAAWWESRRTTLAVSSAADLDDAIPDQQDDAIQSLPEPPVSRRRIPLGRALLAAGVVLAAVSAIVGLRQPTLRTAPVSVPRLERVTNTSALTSSPALSSDGRMVAYVSDGGQDGAAPQVWLQQIGGATIRLTSDQRECAGPSFSADDTRLIFSAKGDTGPNVYEVPTLGGEPRLLQRSASGARFSADGRWLAYVSLDSPRGLRIAAPDATGTRTMAPGLVDVSYPVWSRDSRFVLVHAHPDPTYEPDWWVVPLDGGAPVNTGIIRKLRDRGFTVLTLSPVWVHDALVFSARTSGGANLWRQRLASATFQAAGDPEQITQGAEEAWFPTAAGDRLAFVSIHTDTNLWSASVDAASGIAHGPMHRMTRGAGIVSHLSATRDGRTMAYFTGRFGKGDIFLRNLGDGSETAVAGEPADKGFPTISPGGTQLAYSTRVLGARAMRPIFIVTLPAGTPRKLCDDCGGRPRQWLDERLLLIERFGSRVNAIALVDTTTGAQRELLVSAERSLSNPRVSPDGQSVAFDASRPGGSPSVLVAPLGGASPIPESEWVVMDQSVSHPFWSADGRLLYYLGASDAVQTRSVVRARRVAGTPKVPQGESFAAYASPEMVVPTSFAGTAPIATPDQIVFVLGDFRGDIWMMDLGPR